MPKKKAKKKTLKLNVIRVRIVQLDVVPIPKKS